MLDFVKTINDEEGPLEETRVRYCPNLITLLRLANNIHVLLACVVKNVEDFKMDGEQGSVCFLLPSVSQSPGIPWKENWVVVLMARGVTTQCGGIGRAGAAEFSHAFHGIPLLPGVHEGYHGRLALFLDQERCSVLHRCRSHGVSLHPHSPLPPSFFVCQACSFSVLCWGCRVSALGSNQKKWSSPRADCPLSDSGGDQFQCGAPWLPAGV